MQGTQWQLVLAKNKLRDIGKSNEIGEKASNNSNMVAKDKGKKYDKP